MLNQRNIDTVLPIVYVMNYIAITLVCHLIVFLFEFYFDIRQSRILSLQKALPTKLQSYVDKEEFEDMQTYVCF